MKLDAPVEKLMVDEKGTKIRNKYQYFPIHQKP